MANRYLVAAGGNWTADTSWSTTDGGANDTIAPTASDDVFLTANSGQCTISAASVGKSLNCTGYTGTLTHNAFLFTFSGSVTFSAGMTYTPITSSSAGEGTALRMNANGTLTTAGQLMCSLSIIGGVTSLGDNLSFAASKFCRLTMSNNGLNMNGMTISGNSATNRVIIKTSNSTIGTQRTITNMTANFANVDFQDIAPASGSVDLSAITGGSGDCGGNTNITFTTAATQTYTGGTDNWSTAARWTSRVPLPQDNVLMSGVTGGTITADMPRLGKSIDWTGASGSPTFSNSTATTLYGSWTKISTLTDSGTSSMTFEGRGSFTFTSAGTTTPRSMTFQMISGTMTLQDALTISSGTLNVFNGTFTTNDFALTTGSQITWSTGAPTINLGASTVTVSLSSGTVLFCSGATVNAGTSTFIISDTGASSKTFTGGGKTYNDLKISGGGAGAVIITGANTFNRIYTDGGGTKSITLPGSTTTTIKNGANWGNGGNVITLTASAGSATVSKAAGIVAWRAMNMTNIVGASTGAQYYAGVAPPSVDGTGNTNWVFGNAPDLAGTTVVDYAAGPPFSAVGLL